MQIRSAFGDIYRANPCHIRMFDRSIMRPLSPIVTIVAIFLGFVASTPTSGQKCDLKASGRGLEAKQKAAIKDFGHIFLVEKNPKKAFDAYVPGCAPLISV